MQADLVLEVGDLAPLDDEERQRFREAVRQIAAATLADDAAKRR